MFLRFAFACAVSFLLPAVLSAQAPSVPKNAIEATFGLGQHTLTGPSSDYLADLTTFVRFAENYRVARKGSNAIILSAELHGCFFGACDFGQLIGDVLEPCVQDTPGDPESRCRERFVSPSGFAAGVGFARAWHSRLTTSVHLGATYYINYDAGAYVEAGVATAINPQLDLVGNCRYIVTKNLGGDRVWFAPISLGLRYEIAIP